MRKQRINNISIRTLHTPITNQKQRGGELLDTCYSNIFLVGKKGSGKTWTINEILQRAVGPDTVVKFIVSTIDKDKNYLEICKELKKRNIKYEKYTSIYDDNGGTIIKSLLETSKEPEKKKPEKKIDREKLNSKQYKYVTYDDTFSEDKYNYCDFDINNLLFSRKTKEEPKEEVKKEVKKVCIEKKPEIAPDIILVFDDLSDEIKHITSILKKNRHYKCLILIGSQYPNDLDRGARKQIDYYLIYPQIDYEKLETIHRDAGLDINMNEFWDIYKDATHEKYNFLMVNTNNNELTKNFNERYLI